MSFGYRTKKKRDHDALTRSRSSSILVQQVRSLHSTLSFSLSKSFSRSDAPPTFMARSSSSLSCAIARSRGGGTGRGSQLERMEWEGSKTHERLTFVFVGEEEGTPARRGRPFDNFDDAGTLYINKDERTEKVSCEWRRKEQAATPNSPPSSSDLSDGSAFAGASHAASCSPRDR